MDKKDIADLLNSRRPEPLGMEHRYAVLCLLVEVEGRRHVIFEKRSAFLRSHTGEVSLPGGRIEEGETPKDAAIRETAEELRIPPSVVEILGESDYLLTRQNQAVHCFVGILRDIRPEDIRPEPAEVAYIFTVPLSFFLETEPEVHALEFEKIEDDSFPYDLVPRDTSARFSNYRDRIFFYKGAEKEEQIVWGMTAKIMYGVAQRLKAGE